MSYCLNSIRKLQHLGSSVVHQQIIKYHQELSRIKRSHLPQSSKLSLKSVIFNTFELMQKNCNFPVSLRVHGTVNVKLSISFDFSGGLGDNNCTEYQEMTYDYISDCKRREKKNKYKICLSKILQNTVIAVIFCLYRFARTVAFVNQVSSARFKQPHIATSQKKESLVK